MRFINRQDAGQQLAEKLTSYQNKEVVVYALPRGGVVVGFEIAKKLGLPLDLIITRKIGHSYNPEYAVCAISEDGQMICNESERASLDSEWLKKVAEKEQQEARRRREVYLKNKGHIPAGGKIAIIVDDGIATGLTFKTAIKSILKEKPKEIVVAVPVAPHDVVMDLEKQVDKVIILEDAKEYLGAVGAYYDQFDQVTDQQVISLLNSLLSP